MKNDIEVEDTNIELADEYIENEIETVPENQPQQQLLNSTSLDDMEWLAANIEKMAELQKKIFIGILKLTMPGDFMLFGSGGKQKAELGTAGCERIGRDVGVNMSNVKMSGIRGKDAHGEYVMYEATAIASWRGRQVPVFSIVSSRDKFYGVEKGVKKELSDVSLTDIKKACHRSLYKEAVKTILGLRRLDPDTLKEHGVKLEGSGSYDFKSREEKAATATLNETKLTGVSERTGTTKGNTWKLYTFTDSNGAQYNTFDEALAAKAKSLIGKKVNIQSTPTERGLKLENVTEAKS